VGYAVVGALGIVCSAACGKSKGSKKEAPGTTEGRRVHGSSWWFFLGWASPRIPTLFATSLSVCLELELAFLKAEIK